MAQSVNKVILIGNLGKDPEGRATQSSERVVTLSVATSESWKDKNSGDWKEKTEWHRVVIFNERLAEFAESKLRKGSKVYLEGALQTRKWTDQSGAEKYSTEIVMQKFRGELVVLDAVAGGRERDDDGERRPPPQRGREERGGRDRPALGNRGGGQSYQDLDDEIPF